MRSLWQDFQFHDFIFIKTNTFFKIKPFCTLQHLRNFEYYRKNNKKYIQAIPVHRSDISMVSQLLLYLAAYSRLLICVFS